MSSYKAINESWHRFLTEDPSDAPEETPAPAENDEPPEEEQIVFGINSGPEINPDSLMSMLQSLDFLTKDEEGRLLLLMLKAAEEDDVVLEAIGGPDRDPRTFSPNTTRELNAIVTSFQLVPKDQQKLEKTLKMWARRNTVKFSAPTTAPTEPDTDIELPPDAYAEFSPDRKKGRDPADTPEDEDISDEPTVSARAKPQEPPPSTPEAPRPSSRDHDEEGTQPDSWYHIQMFEDGKGWDDTDWVSATPENARAGALTMITPPLEMRTISRYQKHIKSAQQLFKAGAGLQFKDTDTEKTTLEPKWVTEEESHGTAPPTAVRRIPRYQEAFVLPQGPSSWLRRAKDFLSTSWDKYDTTFDTTMASPVPPAAIKNLEDLITMMESEVQALRNQQSDDPLQEALDRWQTIAGINKRIL